MYKKANGFTLVELLIVIVVVAILAAITLVAYNGIQNKANDAAVRADLRSTYGKLAAFKVLNDRPPITNVDSTTTALRDQARAEINDNFVVTRKAYSSEVHNVLYCRSDIAFGVISQSVSGRIYYVSTNGDGEMDDMGGYLNATLCSRLGIEESDPGRSYVWLRLNSEWRIWFTS